jgi:hypothetical protein
MLRTAIEGFLLLALVTILSGGCQSIGNNESFMLKYKKDLVEFYQEGIDKADTAAKNSTATQADKDSAQAKKEQLILEANTYLPGIYSTDIAYSLSNHYDIRNPARNKYEIRNGEPVNIIVNKVYLADNSELLPLDTGEMAVVVSIDDGKDSKPKDVLVSYEEGILDRVFLPISDLLAYHSDSYEDQPIKVTVTVFEFDRMENENYKKVLGTAATLGAAAMPAYAPAISLASQIGSFLIDQNKDDIIAKFTFQVYPWEPGEPPRITQSIGVPRIRYGQYIVINNCASQYVFRNPCESQPLLNRDNSIHVDFDLTAYETTKGTGLSELDECGKVVVCKNNKLRNWPTGSQDPKVPLEKSYVVLTVSKTQANFAQPIISRLHEINLATAGLSSLGEIQAANVATLGRQLDDLNSNITMFIENKEFQKNKSDPASLEKLFDLTDNSKVNASDKQSITKTIGQLLFPSMTDAFKTKNNITDEPPTDLIVIKSWYKQAKSDLQYDSATGAYTCKHAGCK